MPDYLDIIKCPMDLGSIRKKLEEEIYVNVEEFLDDFQLIWDNCKTYNIKGTVKHLLSSGSTVCLINCKKMARKC